MKTQGLRSRGISLDRRPCALCVGYEVERTKRPGFFCCLTTKLHGPLESSSFDRWHEAFVPLHPVVQTSYKTPCPENLFPIAHSMRRFLFLSKEGGIRTA